MKTLIGRLLTLATALPAIAQADLNHWDFASAKIATDGRLFAEGSAGRNFSSTDPAITLVEDAEAPGGKAIAFSGAQQKSPSIGPDYERPGPVKVSFSVNPANKSANTQQSILMHPGVFELRFNLDKAEIVAYLPQDDSEQIVSVAPMTAGQWHKVELSTKDNKVSLAVDGKPVEFTFPEGAALRSTKAYARVGMAIDARPFTGSIDDLTIAYPEE